MGNAPFSGGGKQAERGGGDRGDWCVCVDACDGRKWKIGEGVREGSNKKKRQRESDESARVRECLLAAANPNQCVPCSEKRC